MAGEDWPPAPGRQALLGRSPEPAAPAVSAAGRVRPGSVFSGAFRRHRRGSCFPPLASSRCQCPPGHGAAEPRPRRPPPGASPARPSRGLFSARPASRTVRRRSRRGRVCACPRRSPVDLRVGLTGRSPAAARAPASPQQLPGRRGTGLRGLPCQGSPRPESFAGPGPPVSAPSPPDPARHPRRPPGAFPRILEPPSPPLKRSLRGLRTSQRLREPVPRSRSPVRRPPRPRLRPPSREGPRPVSSQQKAQVALPARSSHSPWQAEEREEE